MREFTTRVLDLGRKAPDGRELEAVVFGFELKQLSEDGTGAGFLSVMGNEDSHGDVVQKGAFTKTLAERSPENPVPFLWQHRDDEPIGVYTRLSETDAKFAGQPANAALWAEFKYTRGVQRADEAYLLAKDRACKGMSIGYTTIKSSSMAGGLRSLDELRLWEGSQVTFPSNDLAVIAAVKNALERKWNGDSGRYDDAQWKAACILDRGTAGGGSVKERFGLPVANPGNSWREHPDTGGVHAAADRIGEIHASPEARAQAYRRLIQCYHHIGETPPDSVTAGAKDMGIILDDAAALQALIVEIKSGTAALIREPGLPTRTALVADIESFLTSR